jgi:hypothetical protein
MEMMIKKVRQTMKTVYPFAMLLTLAVVGHSICADDAAKMKSIIADSGKSKAGQPEAAPIDTVRLVNGDQLTGRVLGVDADTIVLQSDVLGKVTLPRKQVAEIQMGQRRSTPTGRSAVEQPGQPQPPRVSESTLIKELQARGLPIKTLSELPGLMPDVSLPQSQQTPQDVIRQLRTRGISPGELDQVQGSVPLLAVPGVRAYFDHTLQGLITGRLDLHDLRQEAFKARDGLKDIQKDLGPNGAALNGYLMILDNFLELTEGSTTTAAPPEPEKPSSS